MLLLENSQISAMTISSLVFSGCENCRAQSWDMELDVPSLLFLPESPVPKYWEDTWHICLGAEGGLKRAGPDKAFFSPPSSRCSTPSWDPYHSSHSVTTAFSDSRQSAGPGGGRRHTWTAAAGTADSLPISSHSRRADCVSDRSALASPLACGRWVGMHSFRKAFYSCAGIAASYHLETHESGG